MRSSIIIIMYANNKLSAEHIIYQAFMANVNVFKRLDSRMRVTTCRNEDSSAVSCNTFLFGDILFVGSNYGVVE